MTFLVSNEDMREWLAKLRDEIKSCALLSIPLERTWMLDDEVICAAIMKMIAKRCKKRR